MAKSLLLLLRILERYPKGREKDKCNGTPAKTYAREL